MKRLDLLCVGILCLVATVAGCARPGPAEEPDDQRSGVLLRRAESLTPQSGQGSSLKAAFNENSDKVRLMVLLSPT